MASHADGIPAALGSFQMQQVTQTPDAKDEVNEMKLTITKLEKRTAPRYVPFNN
jgi:hypothetical protein